MSVKTNIKDFYGRVIGTVVEENNGDKTIKDFYGRPLGYYKKGRNVTTIFTAGWWPPAISLPCC